MKKLINISNYYYNKGLKKIKSSNLSESIVCFEKSIELYSKNIDTLNILGLAYFINCEFNSAMKCWKDSLVITFVNNKAVEYLSIIEKDEFKKMLQSYNLGIKSFDEKEYLIAIEYIDEVINLFPDLLEPYIIKASSYLELKEYNKVAHALKKAEKIDFSNYKINLFNRIVSEEEKNQNNYKHKIISYGGFTTILLLLTVVFLVGFGSDDEIESYLREIEKYNVQIDNLKGMNNSLLEENSKLNEIVKASDYNSNVLENKYELNIQDEKELFVSSFRRLENDEYIKALEGFKDIVEYGTELNLVNEATYFTAVTYEKMDNIDNAVKWYKVYINRYKGESYYDDSLYYLGLLLYKTEYREEAENYMRKLRQEVPDSIFNNSRVDFILNQ